MAQIVGAIATSHIPAIGKAIAENKQNDPYWKPFFDGYGPALSWLKQAKPDVVVMIYNDHGLNFFLDKMPTFAVGAAAQYRSEDEGWGLPVLNSFPGDAALSWHLIEHLVADEFDITSCQDMAVDHGFAVPMNLLFPNAGGQWPVKTIPVSINTVQHPLPTPLDKNGHRRRDFDDATAGIDERSGKRGQPVSSRSRNYKTKPIASIPKA